LKSGNPLLVGTPRQRIKALQSVRNRLFKTLLEIHWIAQNRATRLKSRRFDRLLLQMASVEKQLEYWREKIESERYWRKIDRLMASGKLEEVRKEVGWHNP
jgi:hypothetical protein